MELQGLREGPAAAAFGGRPVSLRCLRLWALPLALALALLAVFVASPAPALAAAVPPTLTQSAPPGTPNLVGTPTTPLPRKPPTGFKLTARQARRIAGSDPRVLAALRQHPHLIAYEYTRDYPFWQVSWFTRPAARHPQVEMIQVYVDDETGHVTQVWTGYQVAWTMARGYPGAFGRHVNSLYVWLPMCALFLLPFLPLRFGRRAAAGDGSRRRLIAVERPTLWHLDLLVLLGFSVSLAFFNHGDIGMSVPLVYPFLLYLLVRMLLLAFRRSRPRRPLRLLFRPGLLVLVLVFLVGFRVALNVTDSNVIDVGYAGVIGANKVLFGDKLYGHWPADNPKGDTYGPVNYYAYTPFNVIFGWSGTWDNLPAAHAAAIVFDLLTMLGLFLLGRAIRGPTLGILLAYLWAAYPFTLFALESNSNDSLVALTLVWALLVIRWSAARGAGAAIAAMTKFAPLLLAPLFLRGVGPAPTRRQVIRYAVAFGLTVVAAMAYVLATGDFGAFWRDTVIYQLGRPAPFSAWGLYGGTAGSLSFEQHLLEGATAVLALLVMFFPRRRGIGQLSALGAAVLIALQCCLTYWFYLYIPWFFPLVIVALLVSHPEAAEDSPRERLEHLDDRARPERLGGALDQHAIQPGVAV